MKISGRIVLVASLVVGVAIATATAATAQSMEGSMGPGMMQGGMGQGMMCPMMSGMAQGMGQGTGQGMGHGMMGPGMMDQGMTGSAMMRGATGGMFGSRVTPMMNLSVDDVRSFLGMQLERLNNKRLKVGDLSADDGTISAEIVTIDNALVQRLRVDRRTGAIEYEN
jgi:hypothetical protein